MELVQKKIVEILKKHVDFGVVDCVYNPEDICEAYGLDSIQFIQFLFDIEDYFKIEINPEEIDYDKIREMSILVEIVREKTYDR